jgi:hypothetical protein
MNNFSEILNLLSQAPDTQIDKEITPRLKALAEASTVSSADMKKILDECAFASLASDFAMNAMHIVWQDMIKQEST